jgi:hypothetical protein
VSNSELEVSQTYRSRFLAELPKVDTSTNMWFMTAVFHRYLVQPCVQGVTYARFDRRLLTLVYYALRSERSMAVMAS